MSDFKCAASFRFLVKSYTRHVFWIFCRTSEWARLVSFCVFLLVIFVTVSRVELKIDCFHWVEISYWSLHVFDNSSRSSCFVLAISCTHENLISEQTHASLTSLKTKKNPQRNKAHQKDLRSRHKRVQRGESDSALSILFGHYLEKLFWKEVKNECTKICRQSRSGFSSPRAFQLWSRNCRNPSGSSAS